MKRPVSSLILLTALTCLSVALPAAPPMLMVLGNQIVTVAGHCPVTLHGVDVSGLEYSVTGDGPSGANKDLLIVQNAVSNWNSNFVRLPLNQDFWLGSACGTNGSATGDVGTGYQNLVLQIVNWCNANNVYVLLDLHWSDCGQAGQNQVCGGSGNNGQHDMPDDNSTLFWQSVASNPTIQNNPAVFFDLYNEPGGAKDSSALTNDGPGWNLWRNGGIEPDTSDGVQYHTPGMQGLLNTIRTAGANNMVWAGGENWTFDVNDIGTYGVWLTDSTGNGVVYPTHIYPFKWSSNGCNTPACFDTAANAGTLAQVPVMVTEFGANAAQDPSDFVSGILAWISTNNLSYSAWTLTNGSDPSLISGYFTPNSYFGAPVQFALGSTNSGGCVVGTATNTRSPTVTPTPLPACGNVTLVRVACGNSSPYHDSMGNVWSADYGFGGGQTSTTTNNITNTPDPGLYKDNRWGSPLNYTFNVPDGSYLVTLLESENYWTAAGKRVFNIAIQGTTVLTGYDIYAATGGQYIATSLTFTATVTGGTLSIVGTATTDNAQFAAIELTYLGTPCPTFTVSPTATRTASPSPTASPTGTPSASPSISPTWSVSPDVSQTPTSTATTSFTFSPTLTVTPTATQSATPTSSPSQTPTLTDSPTFSATPTATATPSQTRTASPSPTVSYTYTATPIVSPTPTSTVTNTPTLKPTSTPAPSSYGPLKILSVSGVPNPNPRSLVVQLSGPADWVEADVFTAAEVLALQAGIGASGPGYNQILLPRALQSLASGVYFVRIRASEGGQPAPVKFAKVMLLGR